MVRGEGVDDDGYTSQEIDTIQPVLVLVSGMHRRERQGWDKNATGETEAERETACCVESNLPYLEAAKMFLLGRYRVSACMQAT